jgi:hypothetical protein
MAENARASQKAGAGRDEGKGDGSTGVRGQSTGGLGKSLAQLQAENIAQRLYADFLASAGVSHTRLSQEVLFFLPRPFIDAYSEVFYAAFAGKDDGGVNARGQSQAEQGQLQKGKTAARTNGKKFKRHWVIADEAAVELKDRIDKRLRALAREMREEIGDGSGTDEDRGGRMALAGKQCSQCGRIQGEGWKFCPNDGTSNSTGEG